MPRFPWSPRRGLTAAMPVASGSERLWIASDTGVLWFDDPVTGVWQPVAASSGAAGGDLAGSYPNPTVAAVLGGAYPAVIAGIITTIAASNYSVADTDDTIYCPSSASYTVTLKAAGAADTLRGGGATLAGRRFSIRRVPGGTGVITIASASTINGPVKLTGDNQTVTYQSDGTTWNLLPGTATDVQTFTANGTWTKPGGAYRFARVICIGPGGGGGSGRCDAVSTAKGGGGGGSAGAFSILDIPLSALGATETVVVGTGGAGGTGVSTVATSGNPGANGNVPTTFGAHVSADNGNGGGGGTAAGGVAGANAPNGSFGGGAGGVGGIATGTPTTAASNQAPAGGGGAGGETAGNAAGDGVAGGLQRSTGRLGGTLGSANGGAAGAGVAAAAGEPTGGSGGGGGGGNNAAGAGGAGGAGALYGAGGGGGGSSRTGQLSGAGGAGAAGICVVVCY